MSGWRHPTCTAHPRRPSREAAQAPRARPESDSTDSMAGSFPGDLLAGEGTQTHPGILTPQVADIELTGVLWPTCTQVVRRRQPYHVGLAIQTHREAARRPGARVSQEYLRPRW